MGLDCAQTVHESNVFILRGIALSEKQISRFVGSDLTSTTFLAQAPIGSIKDVAATAVAR